MKDHVRALASPGSRSCNESMTTGNTPVTCFVHDHLPRLQLPLYPIRYLSAHPPPLSFSHSLPFPQLRIYLLRSATHRSTHISGQWTPPKPLRTKQNLSSRSSRKATTTQSSSLPFALSSPSSTACFSSLSSQCKNKSLNAVNLPLTFLSTSLYHRQPSHQDVTTAEVRVLRVLTHLARLLNAQNQKGYPHAHSPPRRSYHRLADARAPQTERCER